MRVKLFVSAAIVAATLMLLAGCGAKSSAKTASTNAKASSQKALATSFPTKPIEMIVPWSAGGGTDLEARTIAKAASSILGQPIVVVDHGGASGAIGMTQAANAKPDGYTLVISTTGALASVPILTKVNYSIKDFTGVVGLDTSPVVLAVASDSKWKTLDDLIHTKTTGKPIIFGDPGKDSINHIAQAAFYQRLKGVKSQYVPFKGTSKAVAALLGGNIDTMTTLPTGILSNVKAGKMRVLGVFGSKRDKYFPNVPTFKEKGFNIVVEVQRFLLVPKGTPSDVVAKLRKAFTQAKQSQSFQNFADKLKLQPSSLTATTITTALTKEQDALKTKLQQLGITG